MKMRWHKFLVNFWLWFSALTHLAEGVLALSGLMYKIMGKDAAEVYAVAPSMKTVDMYFAIMSIALALIAVSVVKKLKNFKSGSIMNLYAFFALELMCDVIYMIMSAFVSGMSAPWFEVILTAVIWAAVFVLNFVYFKKRESMFDK